MVDLNMRLSENFSLREMLYSETAARQGIDNVPNDEQLENLKFLVNSLLQPIRTVIGKPLIVKSGLRVLELNRAVGSKDTSQHVLGEAADIEMIGMSNYELAQFIQDNMQHDQVILEFYTPGNPHSGWVHVSVKRDAVNRSQSLTASLVSGSVQYQNGLIA